MTQSTTPGIPSLKGVAQPAVTSLQLSEARGSLVRYRIMAFVTGTILIAGCIALIFKYGTDLNVKPINAVLWIAHGWLFLVYVVITALLGLKLRWPLARYALVMLAGTIPTMSFVAEHFVTRAAREAASARNSDQPAEKA